MSLFKVRDSWSTSCGRGETFGCEALTVDDLFDTGEHNIIVGSLDGVIRVYGVQTVQPQDLRYLPSDLLIEVQTENPVLQTCTGKLMRLVTRLFRRKFEPKKAYALITMDCTMQPMETNRQCLKIMHSLNIKKKPLNYLFLKVFDVFVFRKYRVQNQEKKLYFMNFFFYCPSRLYLIIVRVANFLPLLLIFYAYDVIRNKLVSPLIKQIVRYFDLV